jgi:hypothetical protein
MTERLPLVAARGISALRGSEHSRIASPTFFAVITIVMGIAEACAHSSSSSSCVGLTGPTGVANTVSGVVTEYGGGPVIGATVYAFGSEPGCNGTPSTQTDQQGRFNWSLAAPAAGLDVWKEGYTHAWKTIGASHAPTNFILHRSLTVNASGETIGGTVYGDEILDSDDLLFGGLCARAACKVIIVNDEPTFALGFPDLAVRLASTDSARQLALYVSTAEVVDFDPPKIVDQQRLCCAADLTTTLRNRREFSPPEYATFLAVASEQGLAPGDSQPFQLSIQPNR